MKKLLQCSALILLAITTLSCEKTLPEQLEEAIAQSEGIEKLSEFSIKDTVDMERVKSAMEQYHEGMDTLEAQLKRVPEQINACESRIADAKEKVKEAPKMLEQFWDKIITDEQMTLARLKLLEAQLTEQIPVFKENMAFGEKVLASQKEGTAYYIADVTLKDKKFRFLVSPNMEILKKSELNQDNQ